MRRQAAALTLVLLALAVPSVAGASDPQPIDAGCAAASPSAAPCVAADKLAEGGASVCRRAGAGADACASLPVGEHVSQRNLAAFGGSRTDRALQLQSSLGDGLPLTKATWIGTHNSFNSVNDDTPTLSHSDSNQQLSLVQQLDVDVRSIELDVHYIPSASAGGGNAVVVCHGRGADQAHFGCTDERTLDQVLAPVHDWLLEHPHEVVLLYVEDELGSADGYAPAVKLLEDGLKRKDGSSLVYHPAAHAAGAACTSLPLSLTRDAVRAAGAQVVLVGNCQAGWSSTVFGWDDVHVESGSTPKYAAAPACDATYDRAVYASKLVRYYEDSTLVARAIDPGTSPSDAQADRLTPAKVAAMTACGVDLFGFDQLLPDDGRLDAAVWTWAADAPVPVAGDCAAQRADARWVPEDCAGLRRAACVTASGAFSLSGDAVPWRLAADACHAAGLRFALPRNGERDAALRAGVGAAAGEVWIAYRVPGGAALPSDPAPAPAASPSDGGGGPSVSGIGEGDGSAVPASADSLEPGIVSGSSVLSPRQSLSVLCRATGRSVVCSVSGASVAKLSAHLLSGTRVLRSGSARLSGGAGRIVLARPAKHGRVNVVLTLGATRVTRTLTLR